MIAHLFWDTAEHLVKTMSKLVDDPTKYRVYLASNASIKTDRRLKETENDAWISKLSPGVYQGGLDSACWWEIGKSKTRVAALLKMLIFHVLVPEFSLSAIVRIARGPKCWVIHGGYLNFPTMLMFRLLGKKVVFIHWGGHVKFWKWTRLFCHCAYRMSCRIYVLMTPELRWFTPFKGDKVELLSYPSAFMEKCSTDMIPVWRKSDRIPRGIMLGNNVWRREAYPEILDRLNPADWDNVVCMLNYGQEGSEDVTERFIEKYRAKFGKAFYPWVGTVSYDEYAKIMASCPFYVCPVAYQSGLGALTLGAYQGRCLIIRGDNLDWYRELGVKVTDLDALPDFSYKTLCKCIPSDAELLQVHANLRKYFVENNTSEKWRARLDVAFQSCSGDVT